MSRQFKKIFTELLAKDVDVGDEVENINPDCEHYKSKGKVVKVVKRSEKNSNKVKNNHNVPGRDVEYKVTNDGDNYEKGDLPRKSADQLKKVK